MNDISLEDYIAVKPKYARFTNHSAGRFQKRRFRKAQCPIVERCARRAALQGAGGAHLGRALAAHQADAGGGFVVCDCPCKPARWRKAGGSAA